MSSTSPLPTSQAASEPRYIILFSKPDDSLPEPLPSLEAIENAPVISEDYSTKHIAFFGNSYVVKYGYDVEPLEADNMRFVRQNTTVRVPRVYAVYQSESLKEGKHKTYIIMEKIAGESLDKLWAEFGAEQKSRIIQQLKESFSALRSLPSPGYYGSIDKKRPRDYLFVIKEPTSSIDEPYYTEEALVNGLLEACLEQYPDRSHQVRYYRQVIYQILKGNDQSVFSHGHLQLKHVMLQPDGSIAILDWALSGWYPVYWEYATAWCRVWDYSNDWETQIELFLDEYPNQYAWLHRLQMDKWAY